MHESFEYANYSVLSQTCTLGATSILGVIYCRFLDFSEPLPRLFQTREQLIN